MQKLIDILDPKYLNAAIFPQIQTVFFDIFKPIALYIHKMGWSSNGP